MDDWFLQCPYCQRQFSENDIQGVMRKNEALQMHSRLGGGIIYTETKCSKCKKMKLQWSHIWWSPEKAIKDKIKHEKDAKKGRPYNYTYNYRKPLDMRWYSTRLWQGFAMLEGEMVKF